MFQCSRNFTPRPLNFPKSFRRRKRVSTKCKPWNFICNLNNGTWNYHLLNHLGYSYTLINSMSVAYTVILALTSRYWRKILRRLSWVKTFGLCNLLAMPIEFLYFLMNPDTARCTSAFCCSRM